VLAPPRRRCWGVNLDAALAAASLAAALIAAALTAPHLPIISARRWPSLAPSTTAVAALDAAFHAAFHAAL